MNVLDYQVKPTANPALSLLVKERIGSIRPAISIEIPTEEAELLAWAANNVHELVERLRATTELCRIKYGNLDKDVYEIIENSFKLIEEMDSLSNKPKKA